MKLSRKVSAPFGASEEVFFDSQDPRVKTLRALVDENAHSYFTESGGASETTYSVPQGKKLIIFGISVYSFNIPVTISSYPVISYVGYSDDGGGGLDCPSIGPDAVIFYSDSPGSTDPNASSPMIISPFPKNPFSALSEPYYAEVPSEKFPFISTDAIGDRDPPEFKMVTEIYGIEVDQ